jgi:hypothetical protein
MRTLAVAMQEHRADLHLTVDELAVECRVPAGALWNILGGTRQDNSPLDAGTVDRLKQAFLGSFAGRSGPGSCFTMFPGSERGTESA